MAGVNEMKIFNPHLFFGNTLAYTQSHTLSDLHLALKINNILMYLAKRKFSLSLK